LVPNGKLLGKYLGDRYPAEEAMERAAAARAKMGLDKGDANEWWDDHDEDEDSEEGPGGRFYGYGQEDKESRLRRKLEERKKVWKENLFVNIKRESK